MDRRQSVQGFSGHTHSMHFHAAGVTKKRHCRRLLQHKRARQITRQVGKQDVVWTIGHLETKVEIKFSGEKLYLRQR